MTPYDNPPSTYAGPADTPECLECGREFTDADVRDETGTMHFEPCAGEYEAALQDRLTDAERERLMMSEEGR